MLYSVQKQLSSTEAKPRPKWVLNFVLLNHEISITQSIFSQSKSDLEDSSLNLLICMEQVPSKTYAAFWLCQAALLFKFDVFDRTKIENQLAKTSQSSSAPDQSKNRFHHLKVFDSNQA